MNAKWEKKIMVNIPLIKGDIIAAKEGNNPELKNAIADFTTWCRENFLVPVHDNSVTELLCYHVISEPFILQTYGKVLMGKNEMAKKITECVSVLRKHSALQEKGISDFYIELDSLSSDEREKIRKDVMDNFDQFYLAADSTSAKKNGVVYTPPEVVDFINNSVNDLLQEHFGKTMADANVEILDPFVGTGNFVVRLLESDILDSNYNEKYDNGLHANELMPMSYYLAVLNIEKAYMDKNNGEYRKFNNIECRDTFQDMPPPPQFTLF